MIAGGCRGQDSLKNNRGRVPKSIPVSNHLGVYTNLRKSDGYVQEVPSSMPGSPNKP